MLLFAALMTAAQLPAAAAVDSAAAQTSPKTCPRTTSHYAWDKGKPLTPRKLTELPQGKGFMAVYRTVDGCEFPMTMVEYRTGGRRR
jgi:hypothetical protein